MQHLTQSAILATGMALLGLLGCGQEDETAGVAPTPDYKWEVNVGPDLEDCTPERCTVIVSDYKYYHVEGWHDYEPGYQYVIVIEQFKRAPDDHPDDAYRYGFRFIEVVSKTKVVEGQTPLK